MLRLRLALASRWRRQASRAAAIDKSSALIAVTRFRGSLERRGVRVSKLILFGSFARGDSRDGSDVDLVVISEDFEGQDYWKRVDLLSEAIYEVSAQKSLRFGVILLVRPSEVL